MLRSFVDPPRRHGALAVAVVAGVAIAGAAVTAAVWPRPADILAGQAPAAAGDGRRAIEAYFRRRSYAPGQLAAVVVPQATGAHRVDILQAGTAPITAGEPGESVARLRLVVPASRRVWIRVGAWPSGLYFLRLERGARVGYAPFVVRPDRLGTNRVAVVLPTHTWQAYNFRDGDGDGIADSWYADARRTTVRLDRAYLDRGLPPHYREYDRAFLRWLVVRGHDADFLAQEDVEAVTGRALRRAYDLVVFPGHHEYVTQQEFDAVETYRDLGGNLAFLSANNFFWRVDRRGSSLVRVAHWRDLGRPEARLVGVGYVDWYRRLWRNRPYVVVGATRAPWLFRGTGLFNGDRFGGFGIEVDAVQRESPPGTTVLAAIPDIFGRGKSAHMTLYTTARGAKVFAAGAFTLAGAALLPTVFALLENVWAELAEP